jgi:hypothetical protein
VLQVALDGVSVDYLNPDIKLPKAAEQELKWCVQQCAALLFFYCLPGAAPLKACMAA